MKELMVTCLEKGRKVVRQEFIYTPQELPLLEILMSCKTSRRRNRQYLEIPAAFDIETTTICKRREDGRIDPEQRPFGFMYHWQFCIGTYVVFGRTWEEYLLLINVISDGLHLSSDGLRLVVWVHNLGFEFNYLRRFIHVTDGFYKAPYKPFRVCTGDGIEYRDSLALSNMSLEAFCRSTPGVIHAKLVDDLDYTKIRTANTFLTDKELAYCYNDVRGLCECIAARMRDDTLASIPMTSTGYVRRDTRQAMRGAGLDKAEAARTAKKNRRLFLACRPSAQLYRILRSMFRGGNTHANALHANQLLRNVSSYDITSSYPAQIMTQTFPVGPFTEYEVGRFLADTDHRKYCYILSLYLEGVEYIGTSGIPYLSESKVERYDAGDGYLGDNGRIRKTSASWMWVTEVDYEIILQTYRYTRLEIGRVYAAQRGPLPDELKNTVMHYYRQKTRLKGAKDDESQYMYGRYKALLNAIFGMMCTRVDMETIVYTPHTDGTLEFTAEVPEVDEALERFYKSRNSFLAYQWGVWITAHARAQLERMLQTIGPDVVYCDTDSIKYLGDHTAEFEAENERLRGLAVANGAYADSDEGERYYLGTWDREHDMDTFKTLGAKKYIYTIGEETFSTISGVSKKKGKEFFGEYGLDAFRVGTIIPDSGHLVAYRNDDDIHEITVDGCTMTTASNLALVNDTYEIGVTGSYMDLLDNILDGIDYIGGI